MFLLLSSGDVLMSRPLVKEQSITKITHKKTNEKVKKKFFFWHIHSISFNKDLIQMSVLGTNEEQKK